MKRTHWIWLFAIITLFLATRILVLLQAGSFWFDEAFSVHFASKPLSELWSFLRFEHNPLAHFVLLHAWMKMFGETELAARALSLVAGFFSLITVFLLGKNLFGIRAGLWSACFFTLSTFFLYHQTEARMYSLLFLFASLALLAFWKWFAGGNRRMLWLAVFTASSMLTMHTHLTAAVLPVCLLAFVLFEGDKRKQLYPFLCSLAFASGTFLLWLIPVMRNKFLAGNVSQGWFFFQQDGGLFFPHLANLLLTGEPSLLLRSISTLLTVILLVMALLTFERPGWWQRIKSLVQQDRWPFTVALELPQQSRLLLLLLLLPLGFGLVFQITITKYLLVISLPVFLFMGKGMSRLGNKMIVSLAALCFLLLVMPMHMRLMFNQRHHWQEAARIVEELLRQSDALVIAHSFVWALPLSRYTPVEIVPFYPLEDTLTFEERIVRYNWQALVNQQNVEQLAAVVNDRKRIILVSSTPGEDQGDPVKAWFWQNRYRLDQRYGWNGYGDPEVLVFVK